MEERYIELGRKKSSYKNQKEHTYEEARAFLGKCWRSVRTYRKQKQVWEDEEEGTAVEWAGGVACEYSCHRPAGWTNSGFPIIIEKYDVWENGRGDTLLAVPMPC